MLSKVLFYRTSSQPVCFGMLVAEMGPLVCTKIFSTVLSRFQELRIAILNRNILTSSVYYVVSGVSRRKSENGLTHSDKVDAFEINYLLM